MFGLLLAVLWRVLRHIIMFLCGSLATSPCGRFVFGCKETPGKIGLPWGL